MKKGRAFPKLLPGQDGIEKPYRTARAGTGLSDRAQNGQNRASCVRRRVCREPGTGHWGTGHWGTTQPAEKSWISQKIVPDSRLQTSNRNARPGEYRINFPNWIGRVKKIKLLIYRILRKLVYFTPLHRWLGIGRPGFDSAYWDHQLSGEFKSYRGGTISVEARNALTLLLAGMVLPNATSLLDMGCASGSLARCPGADKYRYVGVDISSFVIDEASTLSPDCEFHAASLQDYQPDRQYDVISFNEVLYYLGVDDALKELRRYALNLAPGGILIISMKNDPKSAVIFLEAHKAFRWLNGVVYQEKISGPEYALQFSREHPAHLIGVFGAA